MLFSHISLVKFLSHILLPFLYVGILFYPNKSNHYVSEKDKDDLVSINLCYMDVLYDIVFGM